jgi:hypothetical protein
MLCRYRCLKSVVDDIYIITIGTLSGSLFGFMELGAGLMLDAESSGKRWMLPKKQMSQQ